MERIEIPLNRMRVALYLLGCVSLLLLFAWVVYRVATDGNGVWDIIMLVGCAVGSIVPIWATLIYAYKLFCIKHGLIITHEGIVNNAGYTYWGLIQWKDLYSVAGAKSGYNYLIWLGIHKHKTYAKRMNPIRRWLVRNDICFYEMLPPPLINAALLKCKPEELEDMLNTFFVKYGNKVDA